MWYGFEVEKLPSGFKAEVARLNLAKDGVWKTHATDPETALHQTQKIVKIISGEVLEELIPIPLGGKLVSKNHAFKKKTA
jgi:hypothetical protein